MPSPLLSKPGPDAPADHWRDWLAAVLATEHEGRTHLQWATARARVIAHKYRFAPNNTAELEQLAAELLCQKAARFDGTQVPPGGNPDGLFRGWITTTIHWECVRLARSLRGGPTCHGAKGRKSVPLPTFQNELGQEEAEVYAPEGESDEPEECGAVAVLAQPIAPPRASSSWLACPKCRNRVKLRPHEPRQCPVMRCGASLVSARAA
jgi:hypothetical protein